MAREAPLQSRAKIGQQDMQRQAQTADHHLLIETRNEILDQVPEAIFTIGLDGKITYFNQACVELAGRTPLIGRDAWCAMWKIYDENGVQVAPEDSAVATSLRTATPMRGGQLTGERPDGSRFQFLYHTTPLFEGGQLTGALALLIDISAKMEAEAKLEQLETEVAYLSRVAAMGAMGSALAHELSQPLTAAMNYVHTLKRLGERSETGDMLEARPVLEAAEAAEAAIVRAAETLKSLKRMVQRRTGERRAHSLRELVEGVARLIPNGRAVRLQISDDVPSIFVNRVQIEQVIFNLVKNACEAIGGEPDGVVTITSRSLGDMVEVCVVDNGPGIPPKLRENLFSPMDSSKPDGLGVGLSISRAIIENHEGTIRLASTGSGASFCFTVPLARSGRRISNEHRVS